MLLTFALGIVIGAFAGIVVMAVVTAVKLDNMTVEEFEREQNWE
jgi:hypothetical protein